VSDEISLSEVSSSQVRSVPFRLLFRSSNVRSDQAIEKRILKKEEKKRLFKKVFEKEIKKIAQLEQLSWNKNPIVS
jgi:hypothetical protein